MNTNSNNSDPFIHSDIMSGTIGSDTSTMTDEMFESKVRNNLSIYDEAFKKKLTDVFPNVVIAPPDLAFVRSEEAGKIKLPLISLWRMTNTLTSDQSHPEIFRGWRTACVTTDDQGFPDKHIMEQGIAISIIYQVDIWAQLRSYSDGIFRELVFYLWRYPNLDISVPEYPDKISFALKYSDMDQPTDYTSFNDKYIIHRYSLTYEVPCARLFYQSESAKIVKQIPLSLIPLKTIDDWESS